MPGQQIMSQTRYIKSNKQLL